ncbi:DUF3775 domain-containing protein [Prosthecomicrobium sp. N25]|uniref:DUF3775 domain-containing protein n=1 Tax=Prosthecomicrobium sp. N25 TaxID=3129254 RepID=UPI0030788DE2
MEIAPAKVQELIEYLRMMDGKEEAGGFGGGIDGYEDGALHVLETIADDGTDEQIRGVIEGLNVDEKADLVALVWIGRGDFEPQEWPVAVRRAAERATRSTARYLMGIPNVGDLLEEGMAAMGYELE